ncbi:MAG: ABC transporter permease [Bacillota bacterium]|nr:ABC transporter permease [Bacillota bacterium]
MKTGLYPKLALTGIRKNGRLYIPYILTCIIMTAMHYIIVFLSESGILEGSSGGGTMQSMLGFGGWVMALFSLIFLFYTHSFLIRRRKKELGLYNILGMGKGNIGMIMLWENLITAALSLTGGLAAGIGLSKLAELGFLNILKAEIDYSFSVSPAAAIRTLVVFGAIFAIIFVNSIIQIKVSNPAELLKSESTGEKPPKANRILGIAGIVILGAAYYIAVSIKEPLGAFTWFFAAVLMVIAATYIIFITGSVVMCRALQKNKSYYYKANHFVSVSSMAYRMKRNGAGLASICILITMVLVMISSTACLYFGAEDSIHTRYPRDVAADVEFEIPGSLSDANVADLRDRFEGAAWENGTDQLNILDYRYGVVTGLLKDGILNTDVSDGDILAFGVNSYSNVNQVYLIPVADYNRVMGANETLEKDQVMIYSAKEEYQKKTFTIKDGKTFEVKKVLNDFFDDSTSDIDVISSLYIVVSNLDESLGSITELKDYNGNSALKLHWYYGYDSDAGKEKESAAAAGMKDCIREFFTENYDGECSYNVECLEDNREDFYSTFGTLFYMGILLSIVFIFAAVLIIYYKQISEGFEDERRFEIMMKVGMTREDIKKSVNSQMLTVFFLPLVTAVIHTSFAFPMIRKLLILFNLNNLNLFLTTYGLSVLIFGILYAAVYKITSNTYYSIVSGREAE